MPEPETTLQGRIEKGMRECDLPSALDLTISLYDTFRDHAIIVGRVEMALINLRSSGDEASRREAAELLGELAKWGPKEP